jgi:hypothetical protein
MSYIPSQQQNTDAFQRLRTSDTMSVFDSKLMFDKQPTLWDELVRSGTSTYDPANVCVNMAVTGLNGGYVIRQTRMRFNYEPGKSQIMFMTGIIGNSTNTRSRIGYFNSSTVAPYSADIDGIYFEHDGVTAKVCVSKHGTVESANQANWNVDPMNGSGKSGITVDWTKCHIFVIDFQYLGVGRVRLGLDLDGILFWVHEFVHANANTNVYMKNSNHSLRYEIYGTGTNGTGEMKHICCAIGSEGGQERGVDWFIGRTATTQTINTAYSPVLAYRLKTGHYGAGTTPTFYSAATTSNADGEVCVMLNPTLSTAYPAFVELTGSSVEFCNTFSTETISLEGKKLIDVVFSTTVDGNAGTLQGYLKPGVGITGDRDVVVLAVRTYANTTAKATLGFKEQV